MKKEELKRIFLGLPNELSPEEKNISLKIVSAFLIILFSLAILFFLKNLNFHDEMFLLDLLPIALFLFLIFFFAFRIFPRNQAIVILKNLSYFAFLAVILYFGFANRKLYLEIGVPAFLVWAANFFQEIYRLARNAPTVLNPQPEQYVVSQPPMKSLFGIKNRNLGFKGFIWVVLFFILAMAILFLIASL